MVKGSVVNKLSKTGTPSTTGKKPTSKKSATKSPVKSNLPSCTKCGKYVSAETRALSCDRCEDREAWKCIECLDMTQEVYDTLTTTAGTCLKWFCDNCEKAVALPKDEGISGRDDKLGDILKVLGQLVDGTKVVEQRLNSIELTIEGKADRKSVQDLEARLLSVEVRIDAVDNATSLEQRLQKLEEKDHGVGLLENRVHQLEGSSRSLSDRVQEANPWTDMKVKDCIEKAIEVRHTEDTYEKDEREKRKTSVIIHGVAESNGTDAKDREDDDLGVVASMLQEINCDGVQVNKVIRLGKKPLETQAVELQKSRPIKMILNTEDEKVKILRSAKNLRLSKEGGWERIFIHQDLTLKEREERKLLLQMKREREQKGETDLIVVGNRIVKQYRKKPEQLRTPVDNQD
jgi:hypothetical protein